MQCIQLLLVGQNPRVGRTELLLVKRIPEALTGLLHFLIDFTLVLGHLIFEKHIRTVSFFGILVIHQGIVECIYMT